MPVLHEGGSSSQGWRLERYYDVENEVWDFYFIVKKGGVAVRVISVDYQQWDKGFLRFVSWRLTDKRKEDDATFYLGEDYYKSSHDFWMWITRKLEGYSRDVGIREKEAFWRLFFSIIPKPDDDFRKSYKFYKGCYVRR